MHLSQDQLQEIFVGGGVVSEKDFNEIVAQSKIKEISLLTTITKIKGIDEKQLGQVIANHFNIPLVDLATINIPDDILNIIPETIAKRQQAVIFEESDTDIKIALGNPSDTLLAEFIALKTKKNVQMFYAVESDLEHVLSYYNTDFQKLFEKLVHADDTSVLGKISRDVPVKKMVDMLIKVAHQEKSSDIHIEPHGDKFIVRFRIDGILHDIFTLPRQLHDRIVSRIKVVAELRTDEHLSAQDGKMRLILDRNSHIDLRVSILPIIDGEKIVMRLLSSEARGSSLKDLGFSEEDLAKIERALSKSYGMITCTGPTGSGKTTSIYSVLQKINSREINISSIEDPVEYRLPDANQVQVNNKTNLTFANGLRSLLRQDPDYIFVGEIRDSETASIAINAALTGHMVLSTLHTNTAAAALPRLFDMKVEPFLAATTVNLIIGQRLVRRICDNCRVAYTLPLDQIKESISREVLKKYFPDVELIQGVQCYKGEGCRICHHTGYAGRIGVYELLEVTRDIRELIYKKASAQDIEDRAKELGMKKMLEDGLRKISMGLTTFEEVLAATKGDE